MPRPAKLLKPSVAMPVGDTDLFEPTPSKPVRVRARSLPADAHFEPHRHAWSQLAYCASGVLQVSVRQENAQATYIIPPSRAVWIPPGALHALQALEAVQLRTLYIHSGATPMRWNACRVIEVSTLLRELVPALDVASNAAQNTTNVRSAHLSQLVLDEITHAPTQALGIPMPIADGADRRLRALCDAVLHAPASHATLAQWAASIGASERTAARLFRQQLGMGFAQWKQQVILAHALPQLVRGTAVGLVAKSSGYESASAFTAMFKTAMGYSPGYFLRKNGP